MLQTNAPMLFWGGIVLGGLTVCALLIQATLTHAKEEVRAPIEKLFAQLGMDALPLFASLVLAILWSLIFLLLLAGLFGLIWDVLLEVPPTRDNAQAVWDWRFRLVQLTALTTVLGAVVILPVTLQRLRLSKEQTETAKASLFNDKITEAASDLHAQRQVTKEVAGKYETFWEDDIIRRNAAIDRLEGLVREQPREAERVSRLLSVYVRELSTENPPDTVLTTEDDNDFLEWVDNPATPRSDMQNATQTLGRLRNIHGVVRQSVQIDLRGANLQNMHLSSLRFSEANLSGAHLDRATLSRSDFSQANLSRVSFAGAGLLETKFSRGDFESARFYRTRLVNANLEDSDLSSADFTKAFLSNSNLNKCVLWDTDFSRAMIYKCNIGSADLGTANLSGAFLVSVLVNHETSFSTGYKSLNAGLLGAAIWNVDLSSLPEQSLVLTEVFGDRSVTLPPSIPFPAHWAKKKLRVSEFVSSWKEFAKSQGVETAR